MVDVKELQKKLQDITKLPKEEQENAVFQILTPDEIAFLQAQQQKTAKEGGNCLFCKISAGEVPAKIVYQDDFVMAFLDISPANPGHVLVIPRDHYEVLPQMPADRTALLFNTVRVLTGAVFEAVNAEGVSVLQSNGPIAGQVVPHVHAHIVPRFKQDKFVIDRPKESIKLEEKQMDDIQKKIMSIAKSKTDKKVVYDVSGKPIEKEKPSEEKPKEVSKKEKPPKVKRKLP